MTKDAPKILYAVWFTTKCVPDVVVIDYGIPVSIDVLANDMFGSYGTLVCLSKLGESGVPSYGTDVPDGFNTSADGTYGTAQIVDGKVVYQLNSMVMDSPDTFIYVVRYNNPDNNTFNGYYYDTVTVIPATTIYFEDDFIDFEEGWSDAGTALDKIQGEDRPGIYSLPNLDANNIYGYDPANGTCSTYSLGSSKLATVSSASPVGPKASFTFTGTGFDVISLTSKDTGFVMVQVYEGGAATGTPVFTWGVDNFYGYDSVSTDGYIKYVWEIGSDGVWHVAGQSKTETNTELENGEINATESGLPTVPEEGRSYVIFETNYIWNLTTSTDNALYQIPIIKSYDELSYGTYTVVLTPVYSGFFEHVEGSTSYDIYLDAIRIYAPAEGNTTAENAYKQDNEAYPQYIEIRENLIKQDSFGNKGAVFIDAFGKSGTVSDFTSFGPNNEVYLMPGQAIAFELAAEDASKIASVHLGAKALNGNSVFRVESADSWERTLETAADMYYDITGLIEWSGDESGVIIVTNKSGAILSLTTIKLTYSANPEEPAKMFANAMIGGLAAKRVFANYISDHTAAPVEEEPAITEPTITEEPAEIIPEIIPEEIPEVIPAEVPEQEPEKPAAEPEEPIIVPEQPAAPVEEIQEPIVVEKDVTIDMPEEQEIKAEAENHPELPEPVIEDIEITVAKEKSGFGSFLKRVVTAVKTAFKAIARLFGLK